MKKHRYIIEVWFRHSNFEKDFEQINIDANNDEEAIMLAKNDRRLTYKTKIISKDEVNN